jgi:hypothetical protein
MCTPSLFISIYFNAESSYFLQAVKINDDDHTFTLDEELLNEILDDEKVRDKPVCVVSVAGS